LYGRNIQGSRVWQCSRFVSKAAPALLDWVRELGGRECAIECHSLAVRQKYSGYLARVAKRVLEKLKTYVQTQESARVVGETRSSGSELRASKREVWRSSLVG
jgi:hypothetical protein